MEARGRSCGPGGPQNIILSLGSTSLKCAIYIDDLQLNPPAIGGNS